jgi:hypothetical protein
MKQLHVVAATTLVAASLASAASAAPSAMTGTLVSKGASTDVQRTSPIVYDSQYDLGMPLAGAELIGRVEYVCSRPLAQGGNRDTVSGAIAMSVSRDPITAAYGVAHFNFASASTAPATMQADPIDAIPEPYNDAQGRPQVRVHLERRTTAMYANLQCVWQRWSWVNPMPPGITAARE